MKKLSTIGFWNLCWFSKPVCDRVLYKTIAKRKPLSVVHVGLNSPRQASQIVAAAQRATKNASIKYTGIDLFEGRVIMTTPMALKDVHKALSTCQAKVRLIPGDPVMVLPRMSNQLTGTDLLVISTELDRDSLDGCWFFIPRMLHERSLVLLQCKSSQGGVYESFSPGDIGHLAKAAGKPTSKAA